MDNFKLHFCLLSQQAPSFGGGGGGGDSSSSSSASTSGDPRLPSGQTRIMVHAPSRTGVSLWTCCMMSFASFAAGAIVGFTQSRHIQWWVTKPVKRRLRRWVTRYVKRRLRRWAAKLVRPPLRRWATKLLKQSKKD